MQNESTSLLEGCNFQCEDVNFFITQLNNNLKYIEFLAYSKYKMVHKDEKIYPYDKIYRIKDQKKLINPQENIILKNILIKYCKKKKE